MPWYVWAAFGLAFLAAALYVFWPWLLELLWRMGGN